MEQSLNEVFSRKPRKNPTRIVQSFLFQSIEVVRGVYK